MQNVVNLGSVTYSLRPLDLASVTENIIAISTLMQTYANGVILQPDVKSNLLPNLLIQQQTARDTASFFLTSVNPKINAFLANVISVSNFYAAYYDRLLKLAKTVESNLTSEEEKEKATATLLQGIQLFKTQASRYEAYTQDAADILDILNSKVKDDVSNLSNEARIAEQKIESGEIEELNEKIAAILTDIKKDNSIIANGAVKSIVPVIKIAISVFKAFTSGDEGAEGEAGKEATKPEVSKATNDEDPDLSDIDVEIEAIADSISQQDAAMKDITQKINDYKALLTQLKRDEIVYSVVMSLQQRASMLAELTNEALQANEQLSTTWQNINNNIQNVIDSLQQPSQENFALTAQLQQAKKEWDALKEQAIKLQSDGTVPVIRQDLD